MSEENDVVGSDVAIQGVIWAHEVFWIAAPWPVLSMSKGSQ